MALNYIPKLVYGAIPTTIYFPGPPKTDDGEMLDGKTKESVSLTGDTQVSLQFVEATRKVTWQGLTSSHIAALNTFFSTHAVLGFSFDYYTHGTDPSFTTYTLKTKKFNPKKIIPKGTDFLWELELEFRRVAS